MKTTRDPSVLLRPRSHDSAVLEAQGSCNLPSVGKLLSAFDNAELRLRVVGSTTESELHVVASSGESNGELRLPGVKSTRELHFVTLQKKTVWCFLTPGSRFTV